VRAGRSLRRTLSEEGFDAVAERLAAHPLTRFAAPKGDVEGEDEARYRALLTVGVNVIDGGAVLKLLGDGPLPADITAGADPAALKHVLSAWQASMDAQWGVAEAGETLGPAWDRSRQEYAFALAAAPLPGGADEIILRADEYDGTGIVWDSLDLESPPQHPMGTTADLAADPTLADGRITTMLASPLTYRGMPADRFFEFEDASVALGQVHSGPTDLARMLAIDFAVVYSPDWYIAPVELPVGCLARVDWVIVRDTFGVATLVGTSATQASDNAGRQFQPSRVAGVEVDDPYLVVLPSALAAVTSEPREEVALQRDEMANVAWSIEKSVLGPVGRAVPTPWFAAGFELPGADAALQDYELIWRLATKVPDSWTPLVPAQDGAGAQVLRKARILDTQTTDQRRARGLLLADVKDIRDEEITRAGVQLRITEQHARSLNGGLVVWRGREKRSWRGEASSGLRFDAATPKQ
jgi:hypothetical protein